MCPVAVGRNQPKVQEENVPINLVADKGRDPGLRFEEMFSWSRTTSGRGLADLVASCMVCDPVVRESELNR